MFPLFCIDFRDCLQLFCHQTHGECCYKSPGASYIPPPPSRCLFFPPVSSILLGLFRSGGDILGHIQAIQRVKCRVRAWERGRKLFFFSLLLLLLPKQSFKPKVDIFIAEYSRSGPKQTNTYVLGEGEGGTTVRSEPFIKYRFMGNFKL